MMYLASIGGACVLGGLGYLTYLMIVTIRFKNPIKAYIKKVVLNYLKELQND